MQEESEDSLDLLLDTLCNAFGGIILITLLIALMSQEIDDAPDIPTSFKTQWLLEQQQISRIENDLIIEESIGESLGEKIEDKELSHATESIKEKQKLVQKKQSISENLERLSQELAAMPTNSTNLAVDLEKKLEGLSKLNQENAKLKSDLANKINDMEIKLSDVQKGITTSKRERTQTLRLPKEKGKSNKKYIWVLVKYGMIYPLNHPNLKEIFSLVGVGPSLTKIVPKKGRGLDIELNHAETMSFLRSVDARNQYLAFVVTSNDQCFRIFNKVKQVATSMGIGYTWEPKPYNEDFILTSSGGRGAGREL